jgi:PEP-CTERM motif
MFYHRFRALAVTAGVALAGLAFAAPAHALSFSTLSFGQPTPISAFHVTAIDATHSTLSASTGITVTSIDGGLPTTPFLATFNLFATSNAGANVFGTLIFQEFSGTFSITSAACGVNSNCLSGTFTDLFSGIKGSSAFSVQASTPVASNVTFTSDIIPEADLGLDRALSFSMTALTSKLSATNNGTVATTSAQFSGNFSAGPQSVAEPGSLALLGAGVLGLGFVGSRRKQVS